MSSRSGWAVPLFLAVLGCDSLSSSTEKQASSDSTSATVGKGLALPAPRIEPPTVQPGTDRLTRELDDYDFHIEVHAAPACRSEAPFVPSAGSRRVTVAVVVTAKTERLVPVSPLTFALEDQQQHRYGATLAGCGPRFENAGLTRPQSARGELAFDVPDGAHELRLVYEPFLVGRTKVRAQLALP